MSENTTNTIGTGSSVTTNQTPAFSQLKRGCNTIFVAISSNSGSSRFHWMYRPFGKYLYHRVTKRCYQRRGAIALAPVTVGGPNTK